MIGNAQVVYIDAPYDASTSGEAANYLRDTVHDKAPADVITKRRFDLFKQYLPSGRTLPVLGSVVSGNLAANPLFTGSVAVSASGAGSSLVSGVTATGLTVFCSVPSGIAVVCSKAPGGGQRITISGTHPGTGDVYINLVGPTLTKAKKYIRKVHYQLSAADGVGPATSLSSLGLQSASTANSGSDGSGPISAAVGEMILLQRGSSNQVHPSTGLPEDRGEPWFVSRVQELDENTGAAYRVYCSPRAGTVDVMFDIDMDVFEEFHEPKAKPVYMAQKIVSGSTTIRYAKGYAALFKSKGNNFASLSNNDLRFAATNLNGAWVMSQGDWYGDPDSYDQVGEVQKSGQSTWTTIFASAAAIGWAFDATNLGVAAGDTLRFTTTATTSGFGSTAAVETIAVS